MAMEANVTNAAGSLQRLQRTQTTEATEVPVRRGDGVSSSPFAKGTNVFIRNSIADLSSILGRISQGQEDAVEVLPDRLQQVIRNIVESSFSLSATLKEGLGSTMESQRFSLEQLNTLARMLSQLGALAEKGAQVGEFSDSIKTLLQNLKALLTEQEGNSSFEPALLNKLSFQLLNAKELDDLPVALQQVLNLLAQIQPQSGQSRSDVGSLDFLKSLVQYFMPHPGEENMTLTLQEQTSPDGDGKSSEQMAQQEMAGQTAKSVGEQKAATQSSSGNASQDASAGAEESSAENSPSGRADKGKGQTNMAQGQSKVQQQKAPSQGAAADIKSQETEQMPRENKSPKAANLRQEPQNAANQQPNRQEGSSRNAAQEKPLQEGQNFSSQSFKMQGEAKSDTRPMPMLQNTPQLMQSLKDTAAFMLKNMPLTEKDAALLRDFVNNGQRLLPDKDAKQLQLLLRLSQNNIPAAVNQVAMQKNLGDLPRLWVFMQLCDMTAVKDMKAQQLKRAGKDVAEFAASMKRSMEGGSLFQTDSKGNTHRSLNFMLPLYMGEGEKQQFPAYANVYNEEKYSPEDGLMHKETWLRLCILTDHIGTVELTCQVYDAKSLNMRVLFSEPSFVEEFKSYIPEFKESFRTMTLELADLKVSTAGNKE